MIRAALCTLAVVPALFGACGEEGSVGEEAGESMPPPAKQAPLQITEADSGGTVELPVGGETNLRLSSDYVWSEPAVRGSVVALARVDYLQDPGFSEWVVMAQAPGEATIAATGEPACAGQEGCDETPLAFQVTIIVGS